MENDFARGEGAGDVDDALVAGAPEADGEGFLGEDEGAVHEDVELAQQGHVAGVGQKLFIEIASAPDKDRGNQSVGA